MPSMYIYISVCLYTDIVSANTAIGNTYFSSETAIAKIDIRKRNINRFHSDLQTDTDSDRRKEMDKKNIYSNLFGPMISDKRNIPGAVERRETPADQEPECYSSIEDYIEQA